MNEIDPSKYINIINKRNGNKKDKDIGIKKYLRGLTIRVFIVLILFLSLAIVCKKNNNLKDKIYNYIYTEDISFTKFKNIYNKYLGGILPLKKEVNTEKVFNEELKYSDVSIYYDGVKLSVSEGYLVPALKEGMVVFIGNKDNYGNTVIIEDLEGTYIWYGNINNTSLKLYDYVEEGSFIGEVNNNLYMVFSKDDKYLNYEEYIK